MGAGWWLRLKDGMSKCSGLYFVITSKVVDGRHDRRDLWRFQLLSQVPTTGAGDIPLMNLKLH